MATGAYPISEQLQNASATQLAAQAAAMQQHAQLGSHLACPPINPHAQLMDPALLSTLHAQQQHFFSLPPEVQNSAMLMHQHSMALLNVQHMEGHPGKDSDANAASTAAAFNQHSADRQTGELGSEGVPGPPSSHAPSTHLHSGQLVAAPIPALHQQMQLMPFYGAAMHPGFMAPPPGMAIPAPDLPPPHGKLHPPCSDAQVPAANSLPSPVVPRSHTYAHPADQPLDGTAEGSKSNALFIPPPCDGAVDMAQAKPELQSAVNPDPRKDALDVNCLAVPDMDGIGASVAEAHS
jgi:hypothetical protein